MNSNDEIRRLKRFIIISWVLLLLIVIGLVVWASLQFRHFNEQIQVASSKTPVVIRGIDGKQGMPGLSIMGSPGQSIQGPPGQNVTPQEIAQAVAAYLQANPVVAMVGNSGKDGNDGLTLQLRIDPITCQLESKYTISDDWSVVAQLPMPCTSNEAE